MKIRKLIPLCVLGAAAALLPALIIPAGASAAEAVVQKSAASVPADGIVAYYFHGEFRCSTCRKLEALSKEAIEGAFGDELKSGSLRFEIVNMETPETEHFVKDFQLVTKSLVLVEYKDGKVIRWKNLPDIWKLVRNDAAFIDYVRKETEAFLGGK